MIYLNLALILGSLIAAGFCGSVEQAFESYEVVPDVVDYPPSKELTVTYSGGEKASLGNELTPTQTKDMPDVQYDGETNEHYTLLVVDPDAPSRENHTLREYLHCLIVNIPGNRISEGVKKAQYVGPAPPKGSGPHRYVFFIFKQPNKQDFDERFETNDSRVRFSTRKLIDKYSLGKPEYGNFFQAQM